MGNNHKKTWQKVSLSILCVVLALILIVMTFATAYANKLLGKINRVPSGNGYTESFNWNIGTEETDPNSTAPSIHETDITFNTAPTVPPEEGNRDGIVNILLVGQDRRPGQGRQRSDSMILCSFNTNTGKITMISFLRDTYVEIPGVRREKLNAAYAYGGFDLLNKTLAVNFGVHVDANVEVDFDGFTGVIDLLGGVDINVTQKEADYMNSMWGWGISAGVNHFDGERALYYSRIRYIDGDAYRAGRQRNVITALINKYKNKSVTEMMSILEQVLPLVTTNMTDDQIINYLWDLFPMLAGSSIASQQIPASGTYQNMHVGDVRDTKVADMDANRQILKNILTNP